MISCVITICDKDYRNIYSIVNSIHNSMKTDYEILVMDNRDKYKNIKLTNCDAHIIDMGGNMYEFESRKKSISYAKGEYIWFIDGDDKVLDSVIPDDETADLICFNYKLSNNGGVSHFYNEEKSITENIFTLETFESIGNPVWAKLIKKDLLKKIYSQLNAVHRINIMEDATLLFLILYYSKKIQFKTETCYEYNLGTSVIEKNSYADIQVLESLFTGCRLPIDIINSIIPLELQESSRLKTSDLWRNNLFFMKEVYQKTSDDIKEIYYHDIVRKYYSEEEIMEIGGF